MRKGLMGGEARVYLGQRRVLYLRLRVVKRKRKEKRCARWTDDIENGKHDGGEVANLSSFES